MGISLAFMGNSVYLCRVVKTKRSLKNVHIKVDRDTLQIFYEMPSKALPAMAGLDRKVLNSRRITKQVAPSNPVFSRSFITSFGVDSYNKGQDADHFSIPPLFSSKKHERRLAVCGKRCTFAPQNKT